MGEFRQVAGEVRTIRVLVVDAHPVTCWGMSRITDEQPDMTSVGEAGSAAAALSLTHSLEPDVITVGIRLPDRDGLDLVCELRDRYPALGIVVLTAQVEDSVLFRALDTGASAFVSKHADAPEVLAAIRHAAASASSFTAAGLAQALRRRTSGPTPPMLSPRELQVLQLLGIGRSVPEVSMELFVSLSTAKTYVARLYEKLSAANRAQALMKAVQLGLMERPRVDLIDLNQMTANVAW
jgi:DNA-binding NarL/FixJ family response regulator